VVAAVGRGYGVVRALSLDHLIETALVFGQRRWPKGSRIGMAGFSGGAKGLFLDYAEDEGARIATLVPETVDAISPLIDAGVPFTAARHEMGAACMADAYSRATGDVSIISVHQGCGLTNALTGIAEAAKCHTPALVLTGDTSARRGR
jgi:hypothetical protein